MLGSLTGGKQRRETCRQRTPSESTSSPAPFARMLAVVHPPITGSLPRVRQAVGTSSAIDVTFLSDSVFGEGCHCSIRRSRDLGRGPDGLSALPARSM